MGNAFELMEKYAEQSAQANSLRDGEINAKADCADGCCSCCTTSCCCISMLSDGSCC